MRENPDRQEEVRSTGYPALAIRGQSSAGHYAVQMRMNLEVLSPGVQHREEADLGPQMLGVGSNGFQRFGRSLEENVVDHRLILISDRGNLFRYGKHDVKVGDVEQFCLPILNSLCPRQALA